MFAGLPVTSLHRLASGTTRRTVHRGDVLWSAGDAAVRFVAVVSGAVKLTRTDVEEGEVIGEVGDTGSLKGPYLYFEIRHAGEAIDPAPWLDEDVVP